MKYFSLFAGIGGFELGIGKKAKCVGYSEIDSHAIKIYEKHFNHKNYGDITKIVASRLPDFDIIVGGFPCQSFSVAGKRGGFKDTRGTLFFDIARIVKEKKPPYIFLENVKGLLNHDKGNTFATIIAALDELGYDVQWNLLNSRDFGVAQNRERVLIVGHIRGIPRPQIFPLEKTDKKIGFYNERNKKTAIYFDDSVPKATTRRGRVMDVTGALMATPRGGVAYVDSKGELKARQFTLVESERLQGFPDNWTAGISENQRRKCLGNAVTVNVIRAVIKKLIP